jgi:hypothetical protein
VKIYVKATGTITIVKATGVGTSNCEMTTIKTFTITKTGWNVLLFDTPNILADEESLGCGISTDTATLAADNIYDANIIRTLYLHYTQNTWVYYSKGSLIDILGVPKTTTTTTAEELDSIKKIGTFANSPFRFGGQFWAHMFINKIAQDSTNVIIPSESLADIRIASRMGFNVIEANVHATSDGKYIVIHGIAGTFGYEVTDLNGEFTYADTAISSKTLNWIKTNIRYRSDIARYRTTIPTLEEFLTECKICGMIPLAQANTEDLASILDKYMGYGNYIAYNGTRALTNAPITTYKKLTTKAEILADCKSYGVPYIYSMGNMDSFTDEELLDIVHTLHQEGYMLASAYGNYQWGNRAIRLGFDMYASDFFVPKLACGNICNYNSDATFSDFNITGASVGNSVITMANGATITPMGITDSVFAGIGDLRIVFSGKLTLTIRGASQTIESDGTHEMVLSSYYINEVPTFTLTGTTTNTTIYDITFRASKV